MTTAELIERSKRIRVAATPSYDTAAEVYVGRHRGKASRRLGLLRMFYVARHRSQRRHSRH